MIAKSGVAVALITGGSRRIGQEIAREFARAGIDVALNYANDSEHAASAAAELRDMGRRAIAIQADVRNAAQVHAMMERCGGELGGVDILVNNAAKRTHAALGALTLEDWHEATDIVLDGAFLCAQAAEEMLARSGRGAIINIGGLFSMLGAANSPHVAAAKLGLIGVTRSLAAHFGPMGVTVNCVVPGAIVDPTDAQEKLSRYPAVDTIPMQRYGTPADIAQVVRALTEPAFRYVTGQTIHVNGGLHRA